jgi:replicative superfamily II helicase
LAAFRLNQGKSTVDLLKEDKEKTIRKKMEGMPMATELGERTLNEYLSPESKKIIEETNAGYEYTKKKPFKAGGAVKMASGGSASKRADGCAVRGKTKGMMR